MALLGDGECLANGRAFDEATLDGLHAHSNSLHFAIDFDANLLQIGLELTSINTGDFLTDTAEVLRLTAASNLMAQGRLLAGNRTLLTHNKTLFKQKWGDEVPRFGTAIVGGTAERARGIMGNVQTWDWKSKIPESYEKSTACYVSYYLVISCVFISAWHHMRIPQE